MDTIEVLKNGSDGLPEIVKYGIKDGTVNFSHISGNMRFSINGEGATVQIKPGFGPALVTSEKGCLCFGDVEDVGHVGVGSPIIFVYSEKGEFLLWTFLSWFNGAYRRMEAHKGYQKRAQERQFTVQAPRREFVFRR